MFHSEIRKVSDVVFPEYTGVRVLLMPFHVHDPHGSLPSNLQQYAPMISQILGRQLPAVGYLTVDEAALRTGEFHRRPGKHVDGVGPDGMSAAAWGGGGGSWASSGMYIASNVGGCRGWAGEIDGVPGPDGDCAHISPVGAEIEMGAGEVYWCGSMALHESMPMERDCKRQFMRISMPNDCPWYEGCTPNSLGIMPTGPIHPERTAFLNFRKSDQ